MDIGYPALIADLPNNPNVTKPPAVPDAADSEVPQATPDSDPTGSPPTIKQTS